MNARAFKLIVNCHDNQEIFYQTKINITFSTA